MWRTTLPGGLWCEGQLFRDAWFGDFTGRDDLRIEQACDGAENWPSSVSALLAVMLKRIGPIPVDRGVVDGLCVADRQFLLIQLYGRRRGWTQWCSVCCPSCGQPFDVHLDWSRVPVKAAGSTFPSGRFRRGEQRFSVRTPNGGDQIELAAQRPVDPVRWLLSRCVSDVQGCGSDTLPIQAWSDADVGAFDAFLEAMSPEVAVDAAVQCPECGAARKVALEPYLRTLFDVSDILIEVHALASRYHWSENEILALPQGRRTRYLELIAEAPSTPRAEDTA